MSKRIEHLLILGGGTAGWIVANVMALWRRAYPDVRITVVESEQVGIAGTGEGATLLFRNLLAALEIDELEFVRETGATYKLGIEFRDWTRPGECYLNPFNNLAGASAMDAVGREFDYVKAAAIASGERNATQFNVQCEMMRGARAPFVWDPSADTLLSIERVSQAERDDIAPLRGWGYSFHFDGHAVGVYLKRHALRSGVTLVDRRVRAVETDPESGDVRALLTECGERLAADFFIDCSGFHRCIVGRHYREPWRSYARYLPNDAALPFLLPRPSGDLPCSTLAQALSAGWMWRIPLRHRTGCGYVYSRQFLDAEAARREVEALLGHEIEPVRDIRFEPGRFERHWIRNCVAIGLASNFSEPLEATSIHTTILQVQLLAAYLDQHFDGGALPVLADYNRRVNEMLDDVLDFLALHYRSPRDDSAYWKALRHDVPSTPELDRRLALWRYRLPSDLDFAGIGQHASFTTASYLYVMDGLGLLHADLARRELARSSLHALGSERLRKLRAKSAVLAQRAPPHAALIDGIARGAGGQRLRPGVDLPSPT